MLKAEKKGVDSLRSILKDINYLFVTKIVRGVMSFNDPWYDFKSLERAFKNLHNPYENTLLLLYMGIDADRTDIEKEIGKERLDAVLETGLWEDKDGKICYQNLIVMTYQGLYLLVEQNPWFDNCLNKNTDIYIGSDSYRLAENISFRKGAKVLDLCSGSGVQGLMAAKSADKVVSVELNPKTVPVTRFNIALNEAEDKIEVRQGSLFDVLSENEKFDCIYANPPFIPMLDDVVYPICGGGGEDGLMVLKDIFKGIPVHLEKGGEVVIFCECLGDENGVFFDKEVEELCNEKKWTCNVAHMNRLEKGLQINKLATLTALFTEGFDEKDFCRRMLEVYDRLGAKYLYNMLYRIEDTGRAQFTRIDTYNPWHYEDTAQVLGSVTTKKHGSYTFICHDGKEIRMVSEDIVELIKLLAEGYNIERSAKWLYVSFKGTIIGPNVNYYEYLNAILTNCLLLENDGILKRR